MRESYYQAFFAAAKYLRIRAINPDGAMLICVHTVLYIEDVAFVEEIDL